ncbi:MAG: aldo/keto reductase [Planctomycetes bacterium]|nr:aldo/keto reductase [Planctomycetota bacterium]
MRYREFGRTGANVSRLGFGAMRLPILKDDAGRITGIDESAEMIRHGLLCGINYVDSAFYYCHSESETAVGRALRGLARERVYVATKNPLDNDCGSCWRLRLELSLRRLDCGYIDCYHFWGLSLDAWQTQCQGEKGPFAQARKAKEQGLIRHLSFSCHDTPENCHKLIDTGVFESMLVQYNLLDRQYAGCLQHAHEKGLGTVVMGPVGGGRLGTRSAVIAQATGAATTAEAALRFVMANPNVDVVLSGMSTREMIDENVATAERGEPLSAAEVARIDALAEENKRLLDLPCTGCGYCTPCPQGVAIPQIFQMVQWHTAFDLKAPARERYAGLGTGGQEKQKPATACTGCGECHPKCPQKIAIPDRLKEAHEVLTGKA